ncbi:kinase-like domain-containing protein [Gorgonomyces haynaldii]|nr:kinase-like domain-containing protein [Gorgonomyces haynaldii]
MGQLHEAGRKADITTIQKLLQERGADFIKNNKDLHQNTLIHIAFTNGHEQLLDFCFEKKLDVDASNVGGDTPLIIACKRGFVSIAKRLLDAGADINRGNGHGNTALHYACYWRNYELVSLLVSHPKCIVAIWNHYKQLPQEKTSFQIAELLKPLSEGKEPVEALSVTSPFTSLEELRDAIQQDWIIEPQTVQMASIVKQTPTTTTCLGRWKGKQVIVKIPKIEKLSEQELAHIRSELTAIRKLDSPFLSPVIACCLAMPEVYYMIEYHPNGSLEELLFNPEIEMSPSMSIDIAMQVIQGLMALHGAKPYIIHGNLKSCNVLMSGPSKIRLSNYGFQKSLFQKRVRCPNMIFEPGWLPPDWMTNDQTPDERVSDIYVFGLLLYEIIVREPCFPPESPMVLGIKVATGHYPEVPKYVPSQLKDLMQSCWAERQNRPSAQDILESLKKLSFYFFFSLPLFGICISCFFGCDISLIFANRASWSCLHRKSSSSFSCLIFWIASMRSCHCWVSQSRRACSCETQSWRKTFMCSCTSVVNSCLSSGRSAGNGTNSFLGFSGTFGCSTFGGEGGLSLKSVIQLLRSADCL